MVGQMKNKAIKFRVSERRLYKLRLYSAQVDKTMTAILEECIDRLPVIEMGSDSNIESLSQFED